MHMHKSIEWQKMENWTTDYILEKMTPSLCLRRTM